MSRAVVLGAGGGIGTVAARTLLAGGGFDEVVLADLRLSAVQTLADRWQPVAGPTRVTAAAVDAAQPSGVVDLLAGARVVVNCIGPFYRYGPPLLRAAIEAGVDYVDVCDDLEPTLRMLEMDSAARSRGVRALIGMGNSPGLANVLVRYCADYLLDTVATVDIMHVHGGEPTEGPAVIKHRMAAMTQPVPVWEDGCHREVRMLADSGRPYVLDVDFRDVGRYPVYPYPHPETVTLPRHLPGVRRVTNRGVVFPLSYFQLTADLVQAGLAGTEPLTVNGSDVVPVDFAVAHLVHERPRLLRAAGVTGPAGCLRIEVTGGKDGQEHGYVFSLSSRSSGAAEGTGIPAGLGALLMARGEFPEPGVFPPEAVVDPLRILALASSLVGSLGVEGRPDGGALPIHIAHRSPDGSVTELDLAL